VTERVNVVNHCYSSSSLRLDLSWDQRPLLSDSSDMAPRKATALNRHRWQTLEQEVCFASVIGRPSIGLEIDFLSPIRRRGPLCWGNRKFQRREAHKTIASPAPYVWRAFLRRRFPRPSGRGRCLRNV